MVDAELPLLVIAPLTVMPPFSAVAVRLSLKLEAPRIRPFLAVSATVPALPITTVPKSLFTLVMVKLPPPAKVSV